ncbi:hypothetical protein BR93DRAFT_951515 [Coniochaeta sp. PMI_546]|nr:hypothetical protein BR93DRAFT_951515 [Coniochaeta sp. PMI_546]
MLVVTLIWVPFEVIGQIAGQRGFGADIWTIDENTLTYALKLFFIAESMYLAIITLTKISIVLFYLRIFPSPGFRVACYIVMIWVSISGMVFLVIQICQCIPISYSWEGWKGNYGPHTCVEINTLAFTAAGFSIAQDVAILLLPLPLLARLQISRRSKIEVMVMFSLGIFIVMTSCIRLRSIVYFARSSNPTWDYTDALIWTGLEAAVSIIVVSLPAIRVLVTRISPSLIASIAGYESRTLFRPSRQHTRSREDASMRSGIHAHDDAGGIQLELRLPGQ